MRRFILGLAVVAFAQPAQALVLDPGGDWRCMAGGLRFELALTGETYRWSDAEGRLRAGDLAVQEDGLTYRVEMGTLIDRLGVAVIAFDYNGGGERLLLGDGAGLPGEAGNCERL